MQIRTCVMLACALVSLWAAAISFAADAAKASVPDSLRKVGVALLTYSSEYNGVIPANLGMSLDYRPTASVEPLQVYAPAAAIPDELAKASWQVRVDWINQNTCFKLLLPAAKLVKIRDTANTPLVVEEPVGAGTKEKLAVLYADGHVAELPRAEVEAMVKAAAPP